MLVTRYVALVAFLAVSLVLAVAMIRGLSALDDLLF